MAGTPVRLVSVMARLRLEGEGEPGGLGSEWRGLSAGEKSAQAKEKENSDLSSLLEGQLH